MRWAIAFACVTSFVIGIAIIGTTPEADRLPPAGRSIPYLGVVLSWGFVTVGSYAWLRRPDNRTGALMTILGLAVAVSGLQLFDEAVPYALGLLVDTAVVSVLFHLLLAFPSGRLESRAARSVAAVGYACGALQVPLVLISDCADCPDNPLLIAPNDAARDVIGNLQALLAVVAIVGTAVLLIRRWRASSALQRRGLAPVLAIGGTILVLGFALLVTQAADLAARKPVHIAFFVAFALFPVAFLVGLLRTHFFRTSAMLRLIEQLRHDPRGVRDALSGALGDPSLEVAYWLPERGYVDREGRAVEPAPDRAVTEIDHEGRRVGALLHASVLAETPDLVTEASAAAALAIENARLEVELRARLEALRASRARLVEAGDAERRRLGRDLHDGAQQRLVALMIELQLARERFESDPAGSRELLDSAFANAQAAVGELRDLAAGIHPAVLSQRGLDAALESLASRAPIPVERESELEERLPIAVETAAYFVVAEALTNVAKYAQASHARVAVRSDGDEAVVEIRDDGVGGAQESGGTGLRGLADRVGTLDGTLEVDSPPGAGTLIRARFPL